MTHFINNAWIDGQGTHFVSTDPATGQTVWEGRNATGNEIQDAISAARTASEPWVRTPFEKRVAIIEKFAALLKSEGQGLQQAISLETGKPRWEAAEELAAMVNKAPVSIAAYKQRRAQTLSELANGVVAETRYRPHGVVAVFGPFNFPGHLPNGHIVPALLAGNTVVFKPSEYTPLVAQRTIELWQKAGLQAGVINCVQGGRETGMALAGNPGIDGVFFTGSVAAGLSLHRAFAGLPQKILALELGGNNPLIAWDAADTDAVALLVAQSAFLTAGQRCTCSRRLILPRGDDRMLDRLVALAARIDVGPFTQKPEPFMGPVISAAAALQLLDAQDRLQQRGGKILLPMKQLHGSAALLSPGIIDVTAISDRPDIELFGPLLQVIRVADFDAAIREANHTMYGLAAGLISDTATRFDEFLARIRAGVLSWNRPTTGASGSLPFGGVGQSGNHRPSGFYAVDYCSDPVAILQTPKAQMPAQLPHGIHLEQ